VPTFRSYEHNPGHTVANDIVVQGAFQRFSGKASPLGSEIVKAAIRTRTNAGDNAARPLVFALVLKLMKIERSVDLKTGRALDHLSWEMSVWPSYAMSFLPSLDIEVQKKVSGGLISQLKEMLGKLTKTAVLYTGTTLVGWGVLCAENTGVRAVSDFFCLSGFKEAVESRTFWQRLTDRLLGRLTTDPWEEGETETRVNAVVAGGLGIVVGSLTEGIVNTRVIKSELRSHGFDIPSSGLTKVIGAPPEFPNRQTQKTYYIERPN
jgi:hypothetical protein